MLNCLLYGSCLKQKVACPSLTRISIKILLEKMDELLERTPAPLRESVGYCRIVMRKPGVGNASAPGGTAKPTIASASLPMRDKLICFMTGESEEERLIRARLSAYLKLLQSEAMQIDKARRQHYDGGKKLHLDFERQKVQLHKRGLVQLLPAFQMQAWLRVSRAQLVVEMGGRALVILKAKAKHTELTAQHLAAAKKQDKYASNSSTSKLAPPAVPPLSVSDCAAFCQSPEDLVGADGTFRAFGGRLLQVHWHVQLPMPHPISSHLCPNLVCDLMSFGGRFLQLDHMCTSALRCASIIEPLALPPRHAVRSHPLCVWWCLQGVSSGASRGASAGLRGAAAAPAGVAGPLRRTDERDRPAVDRGVTATSNRKRGAKLA